MRQKRCKVYHTPWPNPSLHLIIVSVHQEDNSFRCFTHQSLWNALRGWSLMVSSLVFQPPSTLMNLLIKKTGLQRRHFPWHLMHCWAILSNGTNTWRCWSLTTELPSKPSARQFEWQVLSHGSYILHLYSLSLLTIHPWLYHRVRIVIWLIKRWDSCNSRDKVWRLSK